jgi:hypothetical protein
MSTYQPPVDRLLTLGTPNHQKWEDYSRWGIGPEHVPELLRMMLDMELHQGDGTTDVVWAPLHAWRAVAALKPPEAAATYLTMLAKLSGVDDYFGDWEDEDAEPFFLKLGPASIAPLADFLDDAGRGEDARMVIAEVLKAMAQRYTETRSQVVAILARQLERPESQAVVNGVVVGVLTDLKAVETAALIEKAFREERVDTTISGKWADIGYELGILPKPPERELRRWDPLMLAWTGGQVRSDRAKEKAKAKRKMARASRKRNRRR